MKVRSLIAMLLLVVLTMMSVACGKEQPGRTVSQQGQRICGSWAYIHDIRLPVVEYMLKPIVRQEVSEVLTRIKKKLDERIVPEREREPDNSPVIEPTVIEQIMQYIRDNFTDSQINLTSVAQHFGFSPSYLSRKFKQETGRSFVEYLMTCRMERAIELSGENTKMFCTAREVGIPDPNYFGRCFKKYTGISYSEYHAKK